MTRARFDEILDEIEGCIRLDIGAFSSVQHPSVLRRYLNDRLAVLRAELATALGVEDPTP